METYYAHIENGIVTSVEVVTDEFFNANPERYSGKWIKVGDEKNPYCGKGYLYIEEKDKIIPPQPFNSWKFNEITNQWESPVAPPKGRCYWDEDKLQWITIDR